jgi:hypothetical protein
MARVSKKEPKAEPAAVILNLQDAYMFLVSAVRYALGRRSYIVRWTCDKVREIAPKLTPANRTVLIRDILRYLKSELESGKPDRMAYLEDWASLVDWLGTLPYEKDILAADPELSDLLKFRPPRVKALIP